MSTVYRRNYVFEMEILVAGNCDKDRLNYKEDLLSSRKILGISIISTKPTAFPK